MVSSQTYKPLHSKGNHKQNWKESKTEKTAYIMGEIFANYATDKGLIYKIYKHLTQLSNKQQQDQKTARRPK